MTLTYEWKDVEVNVLNDYGDVPHTHREIRTVRHDYDVNIKVQDIVAYLMPYDLSHAKNKTPEQSKEIANANFYMSKALDFLIDNDACDLEELEHDSYFYDFMKERYEEEAWEDWQECNDAY